jgi:hypothetical protein
MASCRTFLTFASVTIPLTGGSLIPWQYASKCVCYHQPGGKVGYVACAGGNCSSSCKSKTVLFITLPETAKDVDTPPRHTAWARLFVPFPRYRITPNATYFFVVGASREGRCHQQAADAAAPTINCFTLLSNMLQSSLHRRAKYRWVLRSSLKAWPQG